MYRVIVVEDEYEIRQGMKDFLLTLGAFDVVGEADNGIEAFRLVRELQPDIVVTDVRMPGMDGIRLTEAIHRLHRWIKVVVLSGFSEFEYVRSAMKNGACDYLLKTMSVQEMAEFFHNLQRELDEARDIRKDESDSRQKRKQHLELAQADFIRELLHGGSMDSHEIREKLELNQIQLDPDDDIVASVIHITRNAASAGGMPYGDKSAVRSSIKAIMDDMLAAAENGVSTVSADLETVLLLNSKGRSASGIRDFIEQARGSAERFLQGYDCYSGRSFIAGIGRPYSGIIHSRFSFIDAKKAMRYKFTGGDEKCFVYESTQSAGGGGRFALYPFALEEKLLSALDAGDWESFASEFSSILAGIRDNITRDNCNALTDSLFRLVNGIERVLNKWDASLNNVQDGDVFATFSDRVEGCDSLGDVLAWLTDIAQKAVTVLKDRTGKFANVPDRTLEAVKQYIAGNLNRSITLREIADHIYMNPYYFSAWFKNKTGENYMDFIRGARMEEAMKLLLRQDYKVYEVAQAVGYEYSKYFIGLFKKHTGMAPADYRKNKGLL